MVISFPEWIKEQRETTGVLGELAEMVEKIPDWPDEASSDELFEYLPRSMHEALEHARDEYFGIGDELA